MFNASVDYWFPTVMSSDLCYKKFANSLYRSPNLRIAQRLTKNGASSHCTFYVFLVPNCIRTNYVLHLFLISSLIWEH
jgi:hypothetical protein